MSHLPKLWATEGGRSGCWQKAVFLEFRARLCFRMDLSGGDHAQREPTLKSSTDFKHRMQHLKGDWVTACNLKEQYIERSSRVKY